MPASPPPPKLSGPLAGDGAGPAMDHPSAGANPGHHPGHHPGPLWWVCGAAGPLGTREGSWDEWSVVTTFLHDPRGSSLKDGMLAEKRDAGRHPPLVGSGLAGLTPHPPGGRRRPRDQCLRWGGTLTAPPSGHTTFGRPPGQVRTSTPGTAGAGCSEASGGDRVHLGKSGGRWSRGADSGAPVYVGMVGTKPVPPPSRSYLLPEKCPTPRARESQHNGGSSNPVGSSGPRGRWRESSGDGGIYGGGRDAGWVGEWYAPAPPPLAVGGGRFTRRRKGGREPGLKKTKNNVEKQMPGCTCWVCFGTKCCKTMICRREINELAWSRKAYTECKSKSRRHPPPPLPSALRTPQTTAFTLQRHPSRGLVTWGS